MAQNLEFYSSLNLGKNATPEEINQSFKKLSRIIHPDKQDPRLKKYAEEAFSQLISHKEILMNPSTRYIYDEFGIQGVKIVENKEQLREFKVDDEKDKQVLQN